MRRIAATISILLFGRGTSRLPMYCKNTKDTIYYIPEFLDDIQFFSFQIWESTLNLDRLRVPRFPHILTNRINCLLLDYDEFPMTSCVDTRRSGYGGTCTLLYSTASREASRSAGFTVAPEGYNHLSWGAIYFLCMSIFSRNEIHSWLHTTSAKRVSWSEVINLLYGVTIG